jgi:hypothetical protein
MLSEHCRVNQRLYLADQGCLNLSVRCSDLGATASNTFAAAKLTVKSVVWQAAPEEDVIILVYGSPITPPANPSLAGPSFHAAVTIMAAEPLFAFESKTFLLFFGGKPVELRPFQRHFKHVLFTM